jgi:hypothetical protein
MEARMKGSVAVLVASAAITLLAPVASGGDESCPRTDAGVVALSAPAIVFLLAVPPTDPETEKAEAHGVCVESNARQYAMAIRAQYVRMVQKRAAEAGELLGCKVPPSALSFRMARVDDPPNRILIETPWAATLVACPGHEFRLRGVPVADEVLTDDLAACKAFLRGGRRTRR